MVDDGSRYKFFGKSTDFITRFEDMVRSPEVRLYSKWSWVADFCHVFLLDISVLYVITYISLQGLGLPIVTILLEGGKEAIRIVKERLKVGIACIVIEGNDDVMSVAFVRQLSASSKAKA